MATPILVYALDYSPSRLTFFQPGLWGTLSVGSLFPLTCPIILGVLSTVLLPGITRCSKLILCVSCPFSRICHFSKELWVLVLEKGPRSQDLGVGCAGCYWGAWDICFERGISETRERGAKSVQKSYGFFFFFFCFLWPHLSYGSSQTRGQIGAAVQLRI